VEFRNASRFPSWNADLAITAAMYSLESIGERFCIEPEICGSMLRVRPYRITPKEPTDHTGWTAATLWFFIDDDNYLVRAFSSVPDRGLCGVTVRGNLGTTTFV
jgi:hypothetical protein